jgi:feruloyl esterase
LAVFAGAVLLLSAPAASAADQLDLPAVKAAVPCEQLEKLDLGKVAGTAVTFKATVVQTPKGAFCKVAGDVEPGNSFEINLPIDHWTQRYVQSAQGNIAINNAGTCTPATNGDVVVGVDSRTGSRARENWQADPEQRIAFAYLLNHQTALMAKALIRTFYGQAQRFSYFTGCSGGGREVLIEAQRYPKDFDGIAAGAPNILLNVHNGGFYHTWQAHLNERPDGTLILGRDRLGILHAAAVAHCAEASDAMDGILQMPTACRFDPAWVRCPPGAADTTKCLTAEETAVAQKLYQGATDGAGRAFDSTGYPLGSERLWPLGLRNAGAGDNPGAELRYLLPLFYADQSEAALGAAFRYDQAWFDKVGALAPLYNGADTNLRPFQQHGGKLLLWQGAEDTTVQQQTTIAYYQGVQKVLGAPVTDGFLRLFLLPGVAHCGGGDGPAQIDVLSPLMAWVELHRRPAMILAGKPANQRSAVPGEGGGGAAGPRYPIAAMAQPAVLTRPIYPFPNIARYDGRGDPNDPSSYRPVKSTVKVPQVLNSRANQLIGPDNHKFYRVRNGRLVADKALPN